MTLLESCTALVNGHTVGRVIEDLDENCASRSRSRVCSQLDAEKRSVVYLYQCNGAPILYSVWMLPDTAVDPFLVTLESSRFGRMGFSLTTSIIAIVSDHIAFRQSIFPKIRSRKDNMFAFLHQNGTSRQRGSVALETTTIEFKMRRFLPEHLSAILEKQKGIELP